MLNESQILANYTDCMEEVMRYIREHISEPLNRETLAEVAGFRGRVIESGPAQPRSGAVTWMAADTTRARRALGWSPHHDLADSVRAVWAGQ